MGTLQQNDFRRLAENQMSAACIGAAAPTVFYLLAGVQERGEVRATGACVEAAHPIRWDFFGFFAERPHIGIIG